MATKYRSYESLLLANSLVVENTDSTGTDVAEEDR